MENFTLHIITTELQSLLMKQRLGKVYQLGATDLALDFRLRDGRWLMISTDPQRLSLFLTKRNPRKFDSEARTDAAFVSLLRKYLSGARIVSIEKTGYDRVVRFDFEAFAHTEERDEEDKDSPTANTVTRSLVIELIGRAANVDLLEGDTILATLRERAEPITTWREPDPPADKLDPFDCTEATLNALIASTNNDVATTARRHLIGFDVLYARELATRAQQQSAFAALREMLAELFEHPPQPVVYSNTSLETLKRETGRAEFALTLSPMTLHHLHDCPATPFASLNEAADAYFTLLDARRSFLSTRQQIESSLAARLKKQNALVANLQREQANYANADQQQRFGELLLASLHNAVKTEHGFQVTDYYDEAQSLITIPDAAKPDAQTAAEHYFKLARKARHGLQTIRERLPIIQTEVAQLENSLTRLRAIITREQLNEFIAEHPQFNASLPQAAKTTTRNSARKSKEEKLSGLRRYRSSDGYEILVGRSSRDNDTLTMRVAKSYDLWFHAADYPGSHVVLRNPQRQPPPTRAIIEAAQLAAKFSHARESNKVAVNYCERKFVTKPKGFAPGQVRLSSFKTVMVEPKEAGERML